jgi:hypothetical protein
MMHCMRHQPQIKVWEPPADVIAIGKKNLTDDADTKEKAESGKSLWQMGSERREQEAERMKKERQALKKEVASS